MTGNCKEQPSKATSTYNHNYNFFSFWNYTLSSFPRTKHHTQPQQKKALYAAESFAYSVVLNNTSLPLLTTSFLHLAIIHVLQKFWRLIYTITSNYPCYIQQHVFGNIVPLVALNWHCFILYHVRVWTWLIWLRIETGGGHLWMRQWTFRFHKKWRISWLAESQFTFQEGLCSMGWVSERVSEWVSDWASEWASLMWNSNKITTLSSHNSIHNRNLIMYILQFT